LTLSLSRNGREDPRRKRGLLHAENDSSLQKAGLPLPLRERAGVRGNQFRPDRFEHAFYIVQYLIVPESDYSKSLGFQVHGPPGITLHLICVLTTVELHDQSLLKAHKIDDV